MTGDRDGRRRLLARVLGSRRRFAMNVAVALALVGALIVLDFRGWLEARMAYFPSREAFETPAGFEDVTFQAPQGLRLHGWFMPAAPGVGGAAADGRRPAILHVHGNAGHVALHAEFSEFLTQAGFHVFVFDYRGFGRSDGGGRLTRAGLVADTHAAIDYLRGRDDVDPQRLGMFGYSLGGVIGLSAAAERQEMRAVAAVAAFSSWKAIARDHLGGIGGVLARAGVDAEAAASQLGERPLLLLHGSADQIVPAAHSQRLAEVCREAGVDAELVITDGGDHVNVLDPARVRQAVVDFFSEALAPAN
jgi:dipeptidyl aminopeptidase/acylaminoacyl peptidase